MRHIQNNLYVTRGAVGEAREHDVEALQQALLLRQALGQTTRRGRGHSCRNDQAPASGLLHALVAESRIGGRVTVHHQRGTPAVGIAELTRDLQIDIVVMGTVARVRISGFIIGNTAENILSQGSCSVLTLKPHGFVSPVSAY